MPLEGGQASFHTLSAVSSGQKLCEGKLKQQMANLLSSPGTRASCCCPEMRWFLSPVCERGSLPPSGFIFLSCLQFCQPHEKEQIDGCPQGEKFQACYVH